MENKDSSLWENYTKLKTKKKKKEKNNPSKAASERASERVGWGKGVAKSARPRSKRRSVWKENVSIATIAVAYTSIINIAPISSRVEVVVGVNLFWEGNRNQNTNKTLEPQTNQRWNNN